MKCERCETDVPARSRFCPDCGAVIGIKQIAINQVRPALSEGIVPAVVVATVGGGTTTVPATMLFAATDTGDTDAAGGGSSAGARRRRVDRPAMVPLTEFGKEAPPPPRAPLSARSIAIGGAITLAVIALVVIAVTLAAPQANAIWGNVSKLDQRTTR